MEVNTCYGVVIASASVSCILVLRSCRTSGRDIADAAGAPAGFLQSLCAMKQLLGAAMLIFAFWLQVPYAYNVLVEHHIVGDGIVGASYNACWLWGASIFGTLVSGPLADYFGHQEVCAMSCLLHRICCRFFENSNHAHENPIFGSLLSGIAIAVLINTIEVWFAHDFLHKGGQPHLLPATMGRNVLALATVAVLTNMFSSYVVLSSGIDPIYLYQRSIPVSLFAGVWIGYCCDGELPAQADGKGKRPGKGMPDFSDLLWGSAKSAFSEGPALAMAVTQFLVEVSAMVVIFAFSYDRQWRSDLNLPLEYAANLALLAVGSAIFQSYFSKGDVQQQGSLKTLRLSSMCLFMSTTIFTASWQNLIDPTWHFFGVQVQLVPIAILLVHLSVGLYLPASASLRGYLFPDSKRASILGWMRFPVLLAISMAVASIMAGKFTSKILPLSPLFALISIQAVGRLQRVLQTSNMATSLPE